MSLTKQIAEHFKQVHFGGNWTAVNLTTTLADIDWQMATAKVYGLNSIAILVFHMNYYVSEVMLKVMQGIPVTAHDKFSFDMPPIQSQDDWEKLLQKTWNDAGQFIALMEQLDDSKLQDTFITEKFGNYYRNLSGIIEHTHYHLGQIAIIKKIIAPKL
jgi:hypothetical protein